MDNNQSLSARYNIRAIPTLLFFKDGQLRDQITGMASKKDLLSRLESLAGIVNRGPVNDSRSRRFPNSPLPRALAFG